MFKTAIAAVVIASTVALSGCSLPFITHEETCKITETITFKPIDGKTAAVKTQTRTC